MIGDYYGSPSAHPSQVSKRLPSELVARRARTVAFTAITPFSFARASPERVSKAFDLTDSDITCAPAQILLHWMLSTRTAISTTSIYILICKLLLFFLRGRTTTDIAISICSYEMLTKSYNPRKGPAPTGDDVVDSVAMDKYNKHAEDCMDVLHGATEWDHVILDEAQHIKNRSASRAIAAFNLTATYRWCISGTIVVDKIDELYSHFSFFRRLELNDFRAFKAKYMNNEKERVALTDEVNKIMVRREPTDLMFWPPAHRLASIHHQRPQHQCDRSRACLS